MPPPAAPRCILKAVNEQVNITVRRCLTARDRAKHTHISDAVAFGKLNDLFSLVADDGVNA
jgi:hypothetical protein